MNSVSCTSESVSLLKPIKDVFLAKLQFILVFCVTLVGQSKHFNCLYCQMLVLAVMKKIS